MPDGVKKNVAGRPAKAPPDPLRVTNHVRRSETDESLRVERDRTDAKLLEKHTEGEQEADEVVEMARARVDDLVEAARDHADSKPVHDSGSADTGAGTLRERAREDSALERERARADSLLQRERDDRKRYLSDFLAVERDATNHKLTDERALSDQAIATRDDFLATVSHDLRTLLGGMVFNTELISSSVPEGDAGQKTREYVEVARRVAARMNRLINDLLDVVSIDAGKLAVVPEHVEIGRIMQATVEAFESIAAAARVSLDVARPELPLHVRVDDGRIAQVLANLVSNAIKFTGPDGKVSVRVERSGNEVVFTVTDTGIGIPREELETVFGRLRQVRADRRGLGLGLYISKSLIEAHGGSMWAESEVGKGSSFHFALPADPS